MIKDLRKLKYFLGIEVLDSSGNSYLTQRKYCLKLLTEFGMLACKPSGTPIESKEGVMKPSKGKDIDINYPLTGINKYQKLVGKLIYLTHTRPDISYVVHILSQYMHAPLQSHLKLAFRVIRYLKNAPGKGISFNKGDDLNLKVYVDSDWATCKVTRKFVTRYVVFMEKSLVSWKSKKQSMLSKSSTEAEYRAMNSVTCEVMWILKIFAELNEKVANGVVKTVKVRSADNTADIFTKGLSVVDHNRFCENLGKKEQKTSVSNATPYVRAGVHDRVKNKVNFQALEYDVGNVEADLIIPIASGRNSFARSLIELEATCGLKDNDKKPKAAKQKDVKDDGFQSVKWKIMVVIGTTIVSVKEDNGKSMDDLVDDTRKKVKAHPRKTGIWSGRKVDSLKRNIVFSLEKKFHYFDREDMDLDDMDFVEEEVEHENASSKNC
ncbi:hypothetical protein Tco_1240817 [Tanacetum coccineum]